jgi:ribose transport system ATP-binding protein
VEHLFALLRRLKAQGHAIVYISHFIEEVKAITDRFEVLRDGRNAGGGVTADATHDAIVGLMVGTAPGDLFPRTPRKTGEAIVEVGDLEPGFATFSLHRGEILGIAGLVGSGRTRLLRTLFGLESVKRGRLRIGLYSGGSPGGEPATGSPAGCRPLSAGPRGRWRAGMGLLSEDRKSEGLALGLSVADNLTLTRLEPFGPRALVLPGRQTTTASDWIARMAIKCAGPSQPAGELSGGNQQKIAIARLLHHDVDVLVLDEPTRGLDVGSKAQIYKLIDELVALRPDSGHPDAPPEPGVGQAGRHDPPSNSVVSAFRRNQRAAGKPKAVLMVSSYLPELLGLCDRVAVMHRGRLDAPRPAAGLTEHELMMQATTGAKA